MNPGTKPLFDIGVRKRCSFSPCRRYRYFLSRYLKEISDEQGRIGPIRSVTFILLNPSTADEQQDDPTVRRCMGYARRWDMHFLYVVNLFAFRSTDPGRLEEVDDPVGWHNDASILSACQPTRMDGGVIIAGWGVHGKILNRDREIHRLLHDFDVKCLGVNEDGTPSHPLYLKGDLDPIDYTWR